MEVLAYCTSLLTLIEFSFHSSVHRILYLTGKWWCDRGEHRPPPSCSNHVIVAVNQCQSTVVVRVKAVRLVLVYWMRSNISVMTYLNWQDYETELSVWCVFCVCVCVEAVVYYVEFLVHIMLCTLAIKRSIKWFIQVLFLYWWVSNETCAAVQGVNPIHHHWI